MTHTNKQTRIIKFRAWIIREKKMQPVKGLSFDYCEETGYKGDEIGLVIGEPYIDELSIKKLKSLEVANHHPAVDTAILMQFTGLLDKNSVEIYEGDILKITDTFHTYPVPVIWDTDHWTVNKATGEWGVLSEWNNTSEVIGNVWEDEDLLSQTKGGGR